MCVRFFFLVSFQVSASDPDCGVNAMVNYTIGDGFKKMTEFEVKHNTGDICISGNLDFEQRTSYEFPVIATDQGNIKGYFNKKKTQNARQQKYHKDYKNKNERIKKKKNFTWNISLRETERTRCAYFIKIS